MDLKHPDVGIAVCAHISDNYQLFASSHRIEIPENDISGYLWISDIDSSNRYFIFVGARPFFMDATGSDCYDLHQCLSGGGGRK